MDIKSLNEAKKIIADRHNIALERLEYAKNLCMQNEKYANLDKQKRLNILNISKALANGTTTSKLDKIDADLSKKLDKLQAEILGNIQIYHCPICHDTGINGDKYCECLIKEYKKILRQKSNSNLCPNFTFADNNIDQLNCKQSKNLSKLYVSMEKFCNEFPNNKVKNILLQGKAGVGKSCLLACTTNALLDRGVNCKYYTAFHLNSLFLKYHTTNFNDRATIFDELLNAEMLIIDDLGIEPIIKNVTIEYLISLLNERAQKHTIISTNLTDLELQEKYGDRVFSRITNTSTTNVLYLDGDDLRHIKK